MKKKKKKYCARERTMAGVSKGMTLLPYILSPDCRKHTDWLTAAFDAHVGKDISLSEDGARVLHCTVNIGGNDLYMSDRCGPSSRDIENEKVFGFMCHFNMTNEEDAKVVWKKALDSGAKVAVDLKLQYWGGLHGVVVDPFGYSWSIHVFPGNGNTAEP